MGITDVTFIYAERLAMGLQVQEAAPATATGQIERAVEACKAAA
jgi:FMN-dependent NADH-azoreductase